jgi:hypothetical protein
LSKLRDEIRGKIDLDYLEDYGANPRYYNKLGKNIETKKIINQIYPNKFSNSLSS